MYSKGISWISDCRIPFVEKDGWGTRHNKEYPEWKGAKNFTHPEQILSQDIRGRFPANLLVSDDMLNDGSESKGKVGMSQQSSINNIYGKFISKGNTTINDGIKDKGSNSRYYNIDKWFEKLLNED